jgi:glycosyltransferase involved in cell wall biosynthesis
MGDRLKELYPTCQRVFVISGAAFVEDPPIRLKLRARPSTLGFLSNISLEKGILEYLETVRVLTEFDKGISAVLAGPFVSLGVEAIVRERMKEIRGLRYLGPVDGMEKRHFFNTIDVLVFPTQGEAEGLVVHEAMAVGVPVIARGHGCIPSIVAVESGLAVPISDDFVTSAVGLIRSWQDSENSFAEVSARARERYKQVHATNSEQFRQLVYRLSTIARADGAQP